MCSSFLFSFNSCFCFLSFISRNSDKETPFSHSRGASFWSDHFLLWSRTSQVRISFPILDEKELFKCSVDHLVMKLHHHLHLRHLLLMMIIDNNLLRRRSEWQREEDSYQKTRVTCFLSFTSYSEKWCSWNSFERTTMKNGLLKNEGGLARKNETTWGEACKSGRINELADLNKKTVFMHTLCLSLSCHWKMVLKSKRKGSRLSFNPSIF